MFCPNCQTQNPDGVGFCGRCGTPLTAPVQPAYQPAPVNPVVAAAKKVCASPLTLIAAIAFTLTWLLSFISTISATGSAFDMIYEMLGTAGLEGAGMMDMMRDVESLVIPAYLIGSIPTIFVIIGLWITYTGNLNRQSPIGRTGGLGLIKAGMIIELIFACVVLGIASIGTIGGGISLMNSYYSQDEAPILLGLGVGMLIALVFVIIFYVLILKSLKAAKLALKNGQAVKKASAFVGVLCFIGAVFGLLSQLGNADMMGAMGLLSTVCSSLAAVLFGVLIFSFRSKLAPYQVAFAQPTYAQPMYQQPAYQQPAYQPAYQQPVYQQAAQPAYQPVVTPAYQPAPQPVAVAAPPVYQPAPAPVEPVVEAAPVVEPVAEPVVEAAPVVEPVAEPVVEAAPMVEPVAEPVVEAAPVVEPVAEPVVEAAPVVEPVAEPVVEVAPVVEPIAEPVVETAPVEEPVLAPAEEPIVPPVVAAPAPQPAAPARVFCTQCGQPLTADQRFCPNCGKANQ